MNPTERALAAEKKLRALLAQEPDWQETRDVQNLAARLLRELAVLERNVPLAEPKVRARLLRAEGTQLKNRARQTAGKLQRASETLEGYLGILDLLFHPHAGSKRREDFLAEARRHLHRIQTNFPLADERAQQYLQRHALKENVKELEDFVAKLKRETDYGSRVDYFESWVNLYGLLRSALERKQDLPGFNLYLPPSVLKKLRQEAPQRINPSFEVHTLEISPLEAKRLSAAAWRIFNYFSSRAAGTRGLRILRTAVMGLSMPGTFRMGFGEADLSSLGAGGYNVLSDGIGIIGFDAAVLTERNLGPKRNQGKAIAKVLQNELFELGWRRAYGKPVTSPKFQAISFVVSLRFEAYLVNSQNAKISFLAEYHQALQKYKTETSTVDLPSRSEMLAEFQRKQRMAAKLGLAHDELKLYNFRTSGEIHEFYNLIDAMLDFASDGKVTSLTALPD